ncbi:lysosome-associated membrane glycoprotein 3 [Tachyglossus aculeatus]|uniref:lysosome-associated membrane glycoprotein 3 n=1 Tax=Tachyglossus aculeatus TaxID=9261 RepID=UPI0018F65A24|nr:lysosome-associated membrane glycoprotein 3 [Tachyglossus aculeatus]
MKRRVSAVVVLSVIFVAIFCYYRPPTDTFPKIKLQLLARTSATQTPAKTSLCQPDNQTTQRAASNTSPSTQTSHTTLKANPTAFPTTVKSKPATYAGRITTTTHSVTQTTSAARTATVTTTLTTRPTSTTPGAGRPTTLTPCAIVTTPPTVSYTTNGITGTESAVSQTVTAAPTANSTSNHTVTKTTHAITTTSEAHNVTQTTWLTTTPAGPTLAPRPSSPTVGTYRVSNGSRMCVKAVMGIQLIVQDQQKGYFNIDPNATKATGDCGTCKVNLLLTFSSGFVNFNFTKDGGSYYISSIEARLTVSSPRMDHHGVKKDVQWFKTLVGHSFQCLSTQSVQLGNDLQLQTVNVQLQAFDITRDQFGNADECFSDRNRRAIPVAVSLSITGLFVVLLVTCLVTRKSPARGYERI